MTIMMSDHALLLKTRAIVVDDNVDECRVTARILRKAGVGAVRAIADPSIAFSELSIFKPDLLIVDLDMAPLDGADLAQLVRTAASRDFSMMAILCLSGICAEVDVHRAISSGIDDFILKPVTVAKLRQRVLRAVRMQQTRKNDHLRTLSAANASEPHVPAA